MRLLTQEVSIITSVFAEFIPKNSKAKLYLYGSRTDDNKKGGDIDLLLIVDSPKTKQQLREQHAKILGKLYLKMGEQKIDITITTYEESKSDPFILNIKDSTIKLASY